MVQQDRIFSLYPIAYRHDGDAFPAGIHSQERTGSETVDTSGTYKYLSRRIFQSGIHLFRIVELFEEGRTPRQTLYRGGVESISPLSRGTIRSHSAHRLHPKRPRTGHRAGGDTRNPFHHGGKEREDIFRIRHSRGRQYRPPDSQRSTPYQEDIELVVDDTG